MNRVNEAASVFLTENKYVYIVLEVGPEWSEIVSVHSSKSGAKRAVLIAKRKLKKVNDRLSSIEIKEFNLLD